jgi:hypothetical protein
MSQIFSKNAVAQIQQMYRWYLSMRGKNPQYRRRGGGAGGGGAGQHAFCKTDAGSGTTLVCFLDTDITGTEITVDFSIANGDNLNQASPPLTTGLRIPVYTVGGDWFFNGLLNGAKFVSR